MKCDCDMRTKLVGDGCEKCNPAMALDLAKETIADQSALIRELVVALEKARVRFVRGELGAVHLDILDALSRVPEEYK